ncbi:Hpt domain-containing protein [Anaerotardibacter muris]|uniref:Hpt domain-containing protein n=1 Tax=Anaerotardibacter muris TaxID=2941505 RepID=UPI00203A7FAC|nr:Hpt domain-containing protein [Anaerotardibacter muris]
MTDQGSAELTAALAEYGIDYANAMERMMDNAALYKQLSAHYVVDENYKGFVEAMALDDFDTAYTRVHTLKGVAGNLSFSTLYALAAQACDELTGGNPEGARALIDAIGAADKSVRAGLDYWQGLA